MYGVMSAHFLQQLRARNFFAAYPQFGTVSAILKLNLIQQKKVPRSQSAYLIATTQKTLL